MEIRHEETCFWFWASGLLAHRNCCRVLAVAFLAATVSSCDKPEASKGKRNVGGMQPQAKTADAAADPFPGIYELTSFKRSKDSCAEKNLAKVEIVNKHFYVAKRASASMSTWVGGGCADMAACKSEAKAFIDTGARAGVVSNGEDVIDWGSFSKRKGSTLTGGRFSSGRIVDGTCTALKAEHHTATFDKGTARFELRTTVYATFPADDVSKCTTMDADQQKVKRSCGLMTVWEGKRLADLK